MRENTHMPDQKDLVVFEKKPSENVRATAEEKPVVYDQSRKKVWKETSKILTIGNKQIPFFYPKWSDPRIVQIGILSTVNTLGQLVFHFQITVIQILLVVITSVLLDISLTYRAKKIILFPASGFISGLSMAFLLEMHSTGVLAYAGYLLAGFLAIGSKQWITIRSKHIFNPSNFAIVAMLLLFSGKVFITPDEWNASIFLIIPILIIGTRLILKARVASVAITYIATEIVLAFAFGLAQGLSMPTIFHQLIILLFSPSILIFTFFMITDPRTAPRNRYGKLFYAVYIGYLHRLFLSAGFGTISLFLPLVITCFFVPLFEYERFFQTYSLHTLLQSFLKPVFSKSGKNVALLPEVDPVRSD